MPEVYITIPTSFRREDEQVVLKYFESAGRLRANEWKLAFEAFDKLTHANIYWRARQMSFADYYKQFVEATHADQFILTLLESENISTTAERLQAEVSRKILSTLQEEGLYAADVEGSQFLAAYTLYWWNSFARGYSFEVEVYRELSAAGIAYTAHDLLNKTERLSPYDLTILGYLGDIKNTTYFLYSKRSLPLVCDFYITRLWHTQRRLYMLAVILTFQVWEQINGEIHTASLEEAVYFSPNPVAVTMEEQTWIVISLNLFLKKVRQKQREES
jgi:hypothetical protein